MSAQGLDRGSGLPAAVLPLRRLSLSEVFGAAFAVIRHSPRAVLALPFIAGLLAVLATLTMMLVFPRSSVMMLLGDPGGEPDAVLSAMSDVGLILATLATQAITGLVFLMGFSAIVIPAMRSTVGLRTTLTQILTLRARRWGWLLLHLIVLAVLVVVIGAASMFAAILVTVLTLFIGFFAVVPALFLLACWLTAGFMFGPAAVLLEGANPFSALARSWRLNRGMWWRNIGTVALLYLMLTVVVVIASMPMAMATGLGESLAWEAADPQSGTWVSIAVFAAGQLYGALLNALFTALTGAIVAVMYLNARIRQEALDVVIAAATEDASQDDALVPGSAEQVGRFHASA